MQYVLCGSHRLQIRCTWSKNHKISDLIADPSSTCSDTCTILTATSYATAHFFQTLQWKAAQRPSPASLTITSQSMTTVVHGLVNELYVMTWFHHKTMSAVHFSRNQVTRHSWATEYYITCTTMCSKCMTHHINACQQRRLWPQIH